MRSTWIFGKKIDIYVFGLTTIFSLLIGSLIKTPLHYFWVVVLLDEPHVFTTYFYTYNSKRFFAMFEMLLVVFPALAFLLAFFCYMINAKYFILFFAFVSMGHFLKQQGAWFFISYFKEEKCKSFDVLINKITYWSLTLGPVLLSLTPGISKGWWFTEGDLPILPQYIFFPIVYFSAFSLGVYLINETVKYQKYRFVNWPKNFHLLNAVFIWSMWSFRIIENVNVGQLLLALGHTVPYLYIGYRYTLSRKDKGEKFFFKLKSLQKTALAVLLICFLISYVEARTIGSSGALVYCAWVVISLTHYLLDSFMWKRKYHPEGLGFLNQDLRF